MGTSSEVDGVARVTTSRRRLLRGAGLLAAAGAVAALKIDAAGFGAADTISAEAHAGGTAVNVRGENTSTAIKATGVDLGGGSAPVVVVDQQGNVDALFVKISNSSGSGQALYVLNQGAGR